MPLSIMPDFPSHARKPTSGEESCGKEQEQRRVELEARLEVVRERMAKRKREFEARQEADVAKIAAIEKELKQIRN